MSDETRSTADHVGISRAGWRRRGALAASALIAAGVPWMALTPPASAATFAVTNGNDAGAGSLRQAVLDANASAGADVIAINLPAGSVITLTTGELRSTDALTVNGPAGGVEVRSSTAARVFDQDTTLPISFTNVSLTGSGASVGGGAGVLGAGGDVSITNGTISNGVTDGVGGGIAMDGNLTLTKARITGNFNGGSAPGGGFYVQGDVVMTDTEISDNVASGDGGAGLADGNVTATSSLISGNQSLDDGGGLAVGGSLAFTGGRIHKNVTSGIGGGAYVNSGSATFTESTVSENLALGEGAGGVFASSGTVTLERSLVTGNGTPGLAGGVAGQGGVTIVNSTVSLNEAGVNTGGVYSGGPLNLTFATIAGNRAPVTSQLRSAPIQTATALARFNRPQAVVPSAAPFTSYGSVVALPQGGGDSCTTGPQTSQGYNFENGGATCGFSQGTDTMNGADPRLSELADHTGPTRTHLPLAGSPLVNRIPAGGQCAGTDQRIIARPQMNLCDIGAVEVRTPTAGDGALATTINTPVNGDVRTYVTDPDGWFANGVWTGFPPSNGSVQSLDDGGGFTYTPDAGFVGIDSFPYNVCDSLNTYCTPNATVTITVSGTAPLAPVTPTFTG